MTRFARPFGQSPRRLVVCPTGCAATQPIPGPRPFGARASSVQKRSRRFCVEPRSGVLIPPVGWLYVKKKPVLSYELFLKYGGEGGIDSLRSPLRGSPFAVRPVCPTGCASCRTPVGGSHPPLVWGIHISKKPVLSYELFLKYGGEGGIRTPDTLPYTHFPGVLLQPLGHLTILYCCLTTWGATGRYYRELR